MDSNGKPKQKEVKLNSIKEFEFGEASWVTRASSQ